MQRGIKVANETELDWGTLRLSASLLPVGQILYVIVTMFYTGRDANNHPVIFEGYAARGAWTGVHIAQFVCTAVMLAGLLMLFVALGVQGETAKRVGRFGAVLTVVSFALCAVVLAVDWVALKQAVGAWVKAPEAEKTALRVRSRKEMNIVVLGSISERRSAA
jgi:hypothetical protein